MFTQVIKIIVRIYAPDGNVHLSNLAGIGWGVTMWMLPQFSTPYLVGISRRETYDVRLAFVPAVKLSHI